MCGFVRISALLVLIALYFEPIKAGTVKPDIDEGPKSCTERQFSCDDGKCIPETFRCDREIDCADGTDEENCRIKSCAENQFSCDDGKCIPKPWRCDGDLDCADGTDEKNCKPTTCNGQEFSCGNGRCIPLAWRCDFDKDCENNSDEDKCGAI